MDPDLLEAITEGAEPMALATIIQVKGSSPRHPGTRMLVGARTGRRGTVGGGAGEARALAACRAALADGRARLLDIEMLGEDIEGQEMVCGGTHTILVEPLLDLAPYRIARQQLSKGRRVLFVKRIAVRDGDLNVETGLFDEQGEPLAGTPGPVDGELASRAFGTGQPCCDEAVRTCCEPALPVEKLLVLGGGHVGQALAAAAPGLGFRTTVVDDRPEILAQGAFPPGVVLVAADFAEAIAAFPFDAATYAVIVTRGHLTDLACLRALLRRDYRYAGFMGSGRKTRFLLEQVLKDGCEPAKVADLWAPVGLDIGAETPKELAHAILGEMIAVRRNAGILPGLREAMGRRRNRCRGGALPDYSAFSAR
jgi:xanthine dehydrogenase accessory factor